jgi:hypothetical protein
LPACWTEVDAGTGTITAETTAGVTVVGPPDGDRSRPPLSADGQDASRHTGAFAATGVLTPVRGASSNQPSCTVPSEPVAVCPGSFAEAGEPVAVEPPAAWPESPPGHVAATQAGAFAFTGADTAVAGSAPTEPAWTVPAE